jgi:hypothetical protein
MKDSNMDLPEDVWIEIFWYLVIPVSIIDTKIVNTNNIKNFINCQFVNHMFFKLINKILSMTVTVNEPGKCYTALSCPFQNFSKIIHGRYTDTLPGIYKINVHVKHYFLGHLHGKTVYQWSDDYMRSGKDVFNYYFGKKYGKSYLSAKYSDGIHILNFYQYNRDKITFKFNCKYNAKTNTVMNFFNEELTKQTLGLVVDNDHQLNVKQFLEDVEPINVTY